MQLNNIPEALNGWKVYCRFSNNSGSVTTGRALLTVSDAAGLAPKVTKSPTGESVSVGGSCLFVAKHEDAIWAEWHFVSPDGTQDLLYTDAANAFPALQIINGSGSTLQLKNIPAGLSGWKVYCRFSNNFGATNTGLAQINVNSQTPGGTVIIDNPAVVYSTDYNGIYYDAVSQRAVITIVGGPTVFSATVSWANSVNETVTWSFSGSFDSRAVMYYSNCVKATITFDAVGNQSKVIDYSNGTGYIQMTGSGLLWVDDGRGGGMNFIKQ